MSEQRCLVCSEHWKPFTAKNTQDSRLALLENEVQEQGIALHMVFFDILEPDCLVSFEAKVASTFNAMRKNEPCTDGLLIACLLPSHAIRKELDAEKLASGNFSPYTVYSVSGYRN